jgi:hypothetical protein
LGLTVARKEETVVGIENRMVAKDGRVIWVSRTVVPLRGELGEIIGSRGSDTDISDRKQRESLGETGREILQILNEPGDLQSPSSASSSH